MSSRICCCWSSGRSVDGGLEGGHPVAGRDAELAQGVAVLVPHLLVVGVDHVSEDDRVLHLHHRRLQVHREQDPLVPGLGHLLLEEGHQRRPAHHRRVHDLAGLELEPVLEHGLGAVGGRVDDPDRGGVVHGDGTFGVEEVAVVHRGHVRLRVAGPLAHRVGVVAGVGLDRGRGAAVGVALPQHRVDGAAHGLVVPGADVALLVGRRLVRVVRQVVAVGLQLADGGLQLRLGGRDVRQLDDVGLGAQGQLAQLGERIGDTLVLGEAVAELRKDAGPQRDVAGLDLDPGRVGEGVDDREEGVRGQRGGLVGVRVGDLGHGRTWSRSAGGDRVGVDPPPYSPPSHGRGDGRTGRAPSQLLPWNVARPAPDSPRSTSTCSCPARSTSAAVPSD